MSIASGLMQKAKGSGKKVVEASADISTALLHAELPPDQKVYVRAPKEAGGGVWRMHKALYGLRASPKAWQLHLRELLLQQNFRATRADTSFYSRQGDSPQFMMAQVDDLGIVGYEDEVMTTIHQVQQHMKM